MKHFPHAYLTSGSPPLVLKHLYFSSFEITFTYFIFDVLVNTAFVFFLILCAFLILLYHFLSHISSIHKSTENNINIVDTHVPA